MTRAEWVQFAIERFVDLLIAWAWPLAVLALVLVFRRPLREWADFLLEQARQGRPVEVATPLVRWSVGALPPELEREADATAVERYAEELPEDERRRMMNLLADASVPMSGVFDESAEARARQIVERVCASVESTPTTSRGAGAGTRQEPLPSVSTSRACSMLRSCG